MIRRNIHNIFSTTAINNHLTITTTIYIDSLIDNYIPTIDSCKNKYGTIFRYHINTILNKLKWMTR